LDAAANVNHESLDMAADTERRIRRRHGCGDIVQKGPVKSLIR